jgi:hypothetical protein
MQEQRMRQMQRPQPRGLQPRIQDPRKKGKPEELAPPGAPGLPLR